jgi:hypothetical protein
LRRPGRQRGQVAAPGTARRAPKRSTLAYANEHRPWPLYGNVFYQLLGSCREVAGSHGFSRQQQIMNLRFSTDDENGREVGMLRCRRERNEVGTHIGAASARTAVPGRQTIDSF